jgi:hypothetical protein
MDFQTFVRKPFTVEAVQVTLENIEEIAAMIGSLEHKADGTPYIVVEKKVTDKKFVPNIFNVYVGFWMTRMGNKTRCYSPKVFNNQFQLVNAEVVDNGNDVT